jgi:ABC-2 type transport system permease protein
MSVHACAAPHNAMTPQRTLRAYCIETKYEFLRLIRMPAYAGPTLVLPIFMYLLIGIMVVGPQAVEDPQLPTFMFAAFAVFAITSPGMYGFGQAFAIERQSGVLTLKRSQPMPAGAYIIAKILSALACTAIVMSVLVALAASFGDVALSSTQISQILVASLLGMAAFCAIGLFVGSLVSGSAALGVVNLIYFPMIYLSGTFFPLPETLAPWALIWPTFYLNQIFYAITLGESAVSVEMCVAVLIALTLLFAGLAAHRLADVNGSR